MLNKSIVFPFMLNIPSQQFFITLTLYTVLAEDGREYWEEAALSFYLDHPAYNTPVFMIITITMIMPTFSPCLMVTTSSAQE